MKVRTCPECKSTSPKTVAFCNACLYRFTEADEKQAAHWGYLLTSAAIALAVAITQHLLAS